MEWVVWTLATGWLIWGIWWSVDHNRLKADRDRWKGACEQNVAYCAQFAEDKDRYRRMAEWLAGECSQQSWLMRERGFKIGVAVSGTMRGCATKDEWLQAAADAVTGEGDGNGPHD